MTDSELLEYTAEFREGILGGDPPDLMCMAVCAPLATLLQMEGVDCELAKGDVGNCNHMWIALPDGRILDPTASQFTDEMPEVYLGPLPACYR
jgi:hypothetical protein